MATNQKGLKPKAEITNALLDLAGPLKGDLQKIDQTKIDAARSVLGWVLGRYGAGTLADALNNKVVEEPIEP